MNGLRVLILASFFSLQSLALTHHHHDHDDTSSSQLTVKTTEAKNLVVKSKSGTGNLSYAAIRRLAPLDQDYPDGLVRASQYYKNIPVYGSQVVYKIVNKKIVKVFGRLAKIKDIEIKETISLDNTKDIIKTQYPNLKIQKIEKTIYPSTDNNHLVWRVFEDGFDRRLEIFVDAHSGEIIHSLNNINSHTHLGEGISLNKEKKEIKITEEGGKYVLKSTDTLKFETYDMSSYTGPWAYYSLPGDIVKSDSLQFEDQAATDAHYYTEKFLSILSEDFNRQSYDGKGSVVKSSVHFGDNYVNAFWNGKQMVYGDGDEKYSTYLSGALDVIAHEITHGITETTSGLIYQNESGALNEAFSDIMSAYAEYRIDEEKFDWKVGEDIWTPAKKGDALRYMNHPTRDKERIPEDASDSRKQMYSRDWYPTRYKGTGDKGGVHLNSGIANLAFVLLSDGGKHPRRMSDIKVRGIGMKRAIQIFYRAFTQYLVPSSNFQDAREACVQAAVELYGQRIGRRVNKAWAAVGVTRNNAI